MTKTGIVLGVVAAVGVGAALLLEHRAQIRERERNMALRQEVERLSRIAAESQPLVRLVLPADRTSLLPGDQWRDLLRLRGELGVLRRERVEIGKLQADNSRLHSNWVSQLLGGKKLSLREIESYLRAKQRSAESLIAAWQVTGDLGLLREAADKYPHDPRVNFSAGFALSDKAFPEERRQRLEAMKQSAPDNALANYLSAQEYLKAGQADAAVQDLMAASGKPQFQDYRADMVQDVEEAYRAAGLSNLEAAEVASGLPLSHLGELKGLGDNLVKLAGRYRQAGDEASSQAILQMGVTLARQVAEPSGQSLIIGEFVSIAIERRMLETVDPASPYDASGRSIKDRIDELRRQREERAAFVKQSENLLRTLSGSDLAGYYARLKTSGELEALRWVMSRKPSP